DSGLAEPVGIADGYIMSNPVGMMNEPIGFRWPAVIDGLLQRIQNEVRCHAAGGSPTDNALGIGIDYKGHIQPSLPSGHIGEVSDPQSIRAIGHKVTLDQISGACRCAIWHSGTHPFATSDTLDTKATHQAFNRAASPRHAFPIQLLPDLANPIDLEVLLPHTLNIHHELFIPLGPQASQLRIPASGGMSPVG